MTIREEMEAREHEILAPWASFADQSKGRARQEPQCDIRPVFQRDRDRILHSKPFRRLKDKTQVFLYPDGDHYRTRMTHTLEVSQNARTIAKALRLNEELVEAIALGHDLGHTPFGHAGERSLNKLMPGGFAHYQQSLRVVERLEKNGDGLNLTWEVRDGIVRHTKGTPAETLEGQIVRLADHIAYINHDIEDALRGGIIYPMDLPLECTSVLGFTHSERIGKLVSDAIEASRGKREICQSEEVGQAMQDLKEFMFANVYTNPLAKGEESKAQQMLEFLFNYYLQDPDRLPADYQEIRAEEGAERAICDYIAGMTDPYAVEQFKKIYIPMGWKVK